MQINGSTGERFRTTVGVRRRYLVSLTLFNTFLERIMSDALEEHDGQVGIGAEILPICGFPMTLMHLLKKSKN